MYNNNVKSKQIAGLWKAKPGSKAIATGKLELPDGRVLFITLINNNYKKAANHPDYVIMAKPDQPKSNSNSFGAPDPFAQQNNDQFAQQNNNPFGGPTEQANQASTEADSWFF